MVPDQAALAQAPSYRKILVPLDHSSLDGFAIGHAASIARQHGAAVYLLHVEEDPTSLVYGQDSLSAEVQAGESYVERTAQLLREQGITVETKISHSVSPKSEIIRFAKEIQPDLLIMGAHGHGGIKDLIFGNTINPVRHNLRLPVLIVRG
jgi:manganese transport protein